MKKSDLKKLIRESITSETQLNEIQNCHCTAKNELGIYNIYYGGPDTPCGGPVVPFGHAACCSTAHLGNVSTAWVDAQPCLNWYGVGGGGQLPGSGKIPGTMDVVTTGVGVKPGDINRLKDPSMKQGRLREEKDKKKLKDIILKTLEKEGGAAGIKALAKAAKTSKDKLKKDLDKMGGVKQHKHGDYISTPLTEVKDIIEIMLEDLSTNLDEKKKKKKDRCHRKADQVYGTKTSAYKSGAIVKCRKGMIWKVGSKKKKKANEEVELKNPKKADLNKDGKLSDYEKTRGAAIEKAMDKDKVKEDYDGPDLESGAYGDPKVGNYDITSQSDNEASDIEALAAAGLEEDIDIGHEDNEPGMLQGDLYEIGKAAMEIYAMLDDMEGEGEIDLPSWWQSKVYKAKEAIVGAAEYLDFELKEPAIDAVVNKVMPLDINVDPLGETVEDYITSVDDLTENLKHKTAIYYVNTNNGSTLFRDYSTPGVSKIKKVKCEKNKIVIFDAIKKHKAKIQTNTDTRMVININYELL